MSQRFARAGVGILRGGTRPPVTVIVGLIDEHGAEFGAESICRHLQVAPSTYYVAKQRETEPAAWTLHSQEHEGVFDMSDFRV